MPFRTSSVLSTCFLISLLIARGGFAAQVSGRVVDTSGRPVPGARILIVCANSIRATAISDVDGRFQAGPAEGTCELRAAVEGMSARPMALSLAPGDEPHEAGTIQLSVSAISESIVVSAAQVDIPLSQASSSVAVITGEELRARQLATVADALREVPGIGVVRSGSSGAVTSVFPRGGESDYTLVFVDGIQANAFGGGFDFAHLAAENIERIEIVRGPQSALYGSNAIGGVVRIVTRNGGPPRGDARLEAGSFGTVRASASTAGSAGAWSWGADAERVASDGLNGKTTVAGDRVVNDDYRRTQAGGSAAWRAPRGPTLRGELRYERDERGFPGPFGSNPIGAFTGIDHVSRGTDTRWLGSLGTTLPTGRRVRTTAQITWNAINGSVVSPSFSDPTATFLSTSVSRRLSARAQSDVTLAPGLEISAGAEFQRERATSTFITSDAPGATPVNRTVLGAFGEARWSRRDRLFVTAGARVENIRRSTLAGLADPFSPRPPLGEDRVVSANPRAAVSWYARRDQASSLKLRAAAGTGIRPPDAFEIAFTDNPALKPERSKSIEAGADQAFASGHAVFEATAFRNSFDDLIVAVGPFTTASRYRTDNISNARASGAELASTIRIRPAETNMDARVSYTFLSSEVLAVDRATTAPAPFSVGDPLLRRPRHQWSADLAVTRGRGGVWLRGGGRSRVLDVEPSLGTFGGIFTGPGYATWAAGGSFKISRPIEVFARIENLLDRRYEEALGFPAPGRGIFAGLRVAARH